MELGRYVKVEFEDRPGMPPSPSFSQNSFLNKLSHVQEGIQPSEQDAVADMVYQHQDRRRPQLQETDGGVRHGALHCPQVQEDGVDMMNLSTKKPWLWTSFSTNSIKGISEES